MSIQFILMKFPFLFFTFLRPLFQYQYVSRISIPHSHSSSDSGLHPLHKEKKECLKNTSLSKGMNTLEVMESESQPISQKYHPGRYFL